MKHIPNIITFGRMACVPWLVVALLNEDFRVALYLIALMGASDALDGFLAKRCRWQSRLGQCIDPVADKLMLVSACLVLGLHGLLPAWLVALVFTRDALIVGGYAYYRYFNVDFDVNPSMASKINTVCQILLVSVVLLDRLGFELSTPVSILLVVVTATTLSSGLGYVLAARALITRRGVSRAV